MSLINVAVALQFCVVSSNTFYPRAAIVQYSEASGIC